MVLGSFYSSKFIPPAHDWETRKDINIKYFIINDLYHTGTNHGRHRKYGRVGTDSPRGYRVELDWWVGLAEVTADRYFEGMPFPRNPVLNSILHGSLIITLNKGQSGGRTCVHAVPVSTWLKSAGVLRHTIAHLARGTYTQLF